MQKSCDQDPQLLLWIFKKEILPDASQDEWHACLVFEPNRKLNIEATVQRRAEFACRFIAHHPRHPGVEHAAAEVLERYDNCRDSVVESLWRATFMLEKSSLQLLRAERQPLFHQNTTQQATKAVGPVLSANPFVA